MAEDNADGTRGCQHVTAGRDAFVAGRDIVGRDMIGGDKVGRDKYQIQAQYVGATASRIGSGLSRRQRSRPAANAIGIGQLTGYHAD
jgi:hypothetical protein